MINFGYILLVWFIPILSATSLGPFASLLWAFNLILVDMVWGIDDPTNACFAMTGLLITNGFVYLLAIRLAQNKIWMQELWNR